MVVAFDLVLHLGFFDLRRKSRDRGEVETPSLQIMRKLTIERMEEIKKIVVEQEQNYK